MHLEMYHYRGQMGSELNSRLNGNNYIALGMYSLQVESLNRKPTTNQLDAFLVFMNCCIPHTVTTTKNDANESIAVKYLFVKLTPY